jgi:hypothetical protein
MKYLLTLVLAMSVLISTPSFCQPTKDIPKNATTGYARVLGTGKTFEEAKLNGFQIAVEIAVGTVVVTEKKSINDTLVRDKVLKHSSGYVDDFKIIDQSQTNSGYALTMDVKVKSSKIAEIILNTGDKGNGTFDTQRIMAQYKTIANERNDAERLIDNLLDEYPKNSFILTKIPTKIAMNSNRDMVLHVPYTFKWSDAWIENFLETVGRVSDPKLSDNNVISVIHKKRKPTMFSDYEEVVLHIDDHTIYKKVFEKVWTTIYIVVTLEDVNNKVMYVECNYKFPNFKAIPSNIASYDGEAKITIDRGSDLFNNFSKVHHTNISFTTNRDMCNNNYYGIQ